MGSIAVRSFLVVSVLSILGPLGCSGGAQRRPVNAIPERSPAVDATAPPELAPSTRRDRRDAPGVRAATRPLVLGKAKDAQCGKLPANAADAPAHALLSGRLEITMPKAARAVAAAAGGPAEEEESRIVLEGGGLAMAVLAKETFQLDPDLYEAEPDAPSKPASLDVEAARFLKATFPGEDQLEIAPVTIDSLRAYAARPRQPMAPPGKDTALVLALLVAQPDGTLETVSFHVRDVKGEHVRNATGAALVGCTRLAERLASTIVRGPRELDREAGPRRVGPASSGDELVVRVPRDYVTVTTATGARLYKLRPLSLYAGSITVSLGERPNAAPSDADRTVEGRLLGRATQWRGKTNPRGGGYLFAEAPTDDGRFAGVLVKATRQATVLDEMRGVAETLAIVPPARSARHTPPR